MSGFIYSGPMNETRRQLWRLARRGGKRGGNLELLADTGGVFVWGHSHGGTLIALAIAAGIVALAWWFGGRRFDTSLWPVWSLAGVFALAMLVNLLFVESFTLDANVRRWRYRRGWRLTRVREEGGAYAELSGLALREYRRPALNPGTVWALALDFADGVRFVWLSEAKFSGDEALEFAQRVARGTALPLTVERVQEH